MAENNENNTSIIPIGSTGLVRVGNSIAITKTLLKESFIRQLGNFECYQEIAMDGYIRSVFNNDNIFFIFSSESSSLSIYDFKQNRVTRKFNFPKEFNYLSCAVSSRNLGLYFVANKTINVYNISDGVLIRELEGHSRWINSITFTPNEDLLISASDDKEIRVWETKNWNCINILKGHNWRIESLVLNSSGNLLYSCGWDNFIIKWDLKEFKEIERIEIDSIAGANHLLISNDDRFLFISGHDNIIRVYDTNTLLMTSKLVGHNDSISHIALHPKQNFIVSSSLDGAIIFWDIEKMVELKTLQAHSKVYYFEFNNQGDIMISGGADRLIKIWK